MDGKEAYFGSDAFSLAPFTNRVAYLEDGDLAVASGAASDDLRWCRPKWVSRRIHVIPPAGRDQVDKAGHRRHFHGKGNLRTARKSSRPHGGTLCRRLGSNGGYFLRTRALCSKTRRGSPFRPAAPRSYYAGHDRQILVRERLARLPVESGRRFRAALSQPGLSRRRIMACASTFRNLGRPPIRSPRCVTRKAAGQRAASDRQRAAESSIAREADLVWPTLCRTGNRGCIDQSLHLPALRACAWRLRLPPVARLRSHRRSQRSKSSVHNLLLEIPRHMVSLLAQDEKIKALGQEIR